VRRRSTSRAWPMGAKGDFHRWSGHRRSADPRRALCRSSRRAAGTWPSGVQGNRRCESGEPPAPELGQARLAPDIAPSGLVQRRRATPTSVRVSRNVASEPLGAIWPLRAKLSHCRCAAGGARELGAAEGGTMGSAHHMTFRACVSRAPPNNALKLTVLGGPDIDGTHAPLRDLHWGRRSWTAAAGPDERPELRNPWSRVTS
jgi:hypothetical protein